MSGGQKYVAKPRYLVYQDLIDEAQIVGSSTPLPVTMGVDAATHDGFARLRVSNPETIFDSKQIHDDQPLFWDEVSTGTGSTGTHSTNTASTVMDVDASTAGTTTRQTFRRFNYQPGKSQLILMTFVLQKSGAAGTGLIRQVGMFDDNNGIFLEEDEGTIQLVRRTYVTGSAVDNETAQASWNIDPFDGTGPSGVTLDWTKSQIMLIDMEWLGVGRVRVGFVIDGVPYYAHQFVHANTLSGVYMSTPNLPLRFYISNDGNYGSAATLEHICSSVMSEGGTQDIGVTKSYSNGGSGAACNTSGSNYCVIGIRLKSTHLDAVVKLIDVQIMNSNANDFQWYLAFNPAYTGTPSWAAVSTDTHVEVATPTTGFALVSLNYSIVQGFTKSGKEAGAVSSGIDSAQLLGADINGTVDEIWLVVRPYGTTNNIKAGITWKEIS